MIPWYKGSPTLFQHEKEAVAICQPSLEFEILPGGTQLTQTRKLISESAVCRGTYALRVPNSENHYDYSIIVITHPSHPREMPSLHCNDPRLPAGNLDRHIMSTGEACLGVRAEIRRKWSAGRGIVGFFDDFVSPFLAWQVYYEAHGHSGPFGQRSHGVQGVIEFYTEVLGFNDGIHIAAFMELLARRNRPKGHECCPCGSGRKLRDCHADVVRNAWGKVAWQDAQADLALLKTPDAQKGR